MRFEVALFAYHRERHGSTLTIEAEPSVPSVMAAIGALGIDVRHSRLAVDEEFAAGSEELNEGSRLALIPPVSGG